MPESRVGQGGTVVLLGEVVDGDDVEIVDVVGGFGCPRLCLATADSLPDTVELLQDGELRSAATGLGQSRGQLRRDRSVAGQHHGVTAPTNRRVHRRCHQADDLGVGHRPSHSRAGKVDRGHVRQDHYPLCAVQANQRAANAMQQRIATGYDVNVFIDR